MYAVIGGGISGIAAAYFLRQAGIQAEVIEQGGQLGGRIASCPLGDRDIDIGGKNIGRRYELFRAFTRDMGDNPYEPFGINSSRVRDGKLLTLDSKQRWRGFSGFLRSCPPRDIVRMAGLCARVKLRRSNGYLGSSLSESLSRRFDHRPLSGHFSDHFCDSVARPMTVRMNAAEPDEAYLGNLGTNIAMVLDTYDQLKLGMKRVLDQFSRVADLRLNTRVEGLLVRQGRVTGLRVRTRSGADEITENLEYDGVVLATPAPISATLLEPHAPSLANHLGRVRYFPVGVVVAEYNRPIFNPTVRAIHFDADSVVSNAGAYGVNDLHVIRYTFSGRTARAYLEKETDDEKLVELGESTLNRHMPVRSSDRVRYTVRRFTQGLCAYSPHHYRLLEAIADPSAVPEGLKLTGDYVSGASIEACFRSAQDAVQTFLSRSGAALPEYEEHVGRVAIPGH